MTIGVLVSSRVIDYWVKLKSATNQMTPEQRLPLMILGGMLLPVGLFIFGVRTTPRENLFFYTNSRPAAIVLSRQCL